MTTMARLFQVAFAMLAALVLGAWDTGNLPPDGWSGTRPVMFGRQAECLMGGEPLLTLFDREEESNGRARIRDGVREIVMNPDQWNHQDLSVAHFTFYHECFHHRLDHLSGTSDREARELEADCAAIRLLRRRGLFDEKNFEIVLASLINNPAVPGFHPGGPERVAGVQRCWYEAAE